MLKVMFFAFTVILLMPNVEFTCHSRFAFRDFNCFLSLTKQLKCFGDNQSGQLGKGHSNNLGDNSGEMGDYLSYVQIQEDIIQVSSGATQICILSSTFQVFCWGAGNVGQLGYGDTQNRGDLSNEMGEYLPPVDFGLSSSLVSEVGCGFSHCLILTDDQKIKAWGFNSEGQLGYGDTSSRGGSGSEMGTYLNEVDLNSGFNNVEGIRIMYASSCVFSLSSNQLACWGSNFIGQLGLGHPNNIGDGPDEMGEYLQSVLLPSGVVVSKLEIGWYHAGIISSSSNQLFLWGYNGDGQLGVGSSSNIGDDTNEMGNYLKATNLGSGRYGIDFEGGEEHTVLIKTIHFYISLFFNLFSSVLFWTISM